jgi:hypothetical protein
MHRSLQERVTALEAEVETLNERKKGVNATIQAYVERKEKVCRLSMF